MSPAGETDLRDRLKHRRQAHIANRWREAARIGARRVVLFESLVQGKAGPAGGLDPPIEIFNPYGWPQRRSASPNQTAKSAPKMFNS